MISPLGKTVFIVFFCIAGTEATLAQSSSGIIIGMVEDGSGGALPNADIKLVQLATGFTRATQTNVARIINAQVILLEVRFNSPFEDSSFMMEPLENNFRWYPGDLHMHTAHRDGFCRSQNGSTFYARCFLTAQTASNRGLDFIAISDHNSLAHYAEMRELQGYFDKMLFIPGREMSPSAAAYRVTGTETKDLYFRGASAIDWRNQLMVGLEVPKGSVHLQNTSLRNT